MRHDPFDAGPRGISFFCYLGDSLGLGSVISRIPALPQLVASRR